MKLFVKDRLIILNALPKEGDLLRLRMIRDLHGIVGFSSEEYQKYGFKPDGSAVAWNSQEDAGVDIVFDSAQMGLILYPFQALDKQGKLSMEQLPTYEKLMEAEHAVTEQAGSGGRQQRKPKLVPKAK